METGPSELSNSRGPVHDLQKIDRVRRDSVGNSVHRNAELRNRYRRETRDRRRGRRSATLPIYSLRGVATWEKVIAAPWLASFRSAAFAQMLLAYTSLCLLRGSPSFV